MKEEDNKKSKTKSFRIPEDLLTKIESICSKEDITFTRFVLQACNDFLMEIADNADDVK